MGYLKNTDKIIKALNIIKDNQLKTPRQFGEEYFKGQPILNRHSNIGNGATRGVGAWFKAGHILKGLKEDGYIYYDYYDNRTIELTKKGKQFIEDGKEK